MRRKKSKGQTIYPTSMEKAGFSKKIHTTLQDAPIESVTETSEISMNDFLLCINSNFRLV